MGVGILRPATRIVVAGSDAGANWPGQDVSYDGMNAAHQLGPLAFDNQPVADTGGFWVGDGTLRVPVGLAGWYDIAACLSLSGGANPRNATSGTFGVDVRINGSSAGFFTPGFTAGYKLIGTLWASGTNLGALPEISGSIRLAEGDVVSIRALASLVGGLGQPYPVTAYANALMMSWRGR